MSQEERDFEEEEYPKNGFDDASYDDEDEDFDDDDQDFGDEEDDGDGDGDGDGYDDDYYDGDGDDDDYYNRSDRSGGGGRRPYRDEIFSKRVPAGKRTYFFDVKTTRSGKDYFLTITESKKVGENRYEKHKIFLYKEDFGKFVSAMHETVRFIQDECLPGYEFRGLPDVSKQDGELEDDWSDEGGSY